MSASKNQANVATIRVKNAEGCSENICSCLLLTLNSLGSFLYVSLYWWNNLWIFFVIFGKKKKKKKHLAGISYFNFSSKQSSAGSISRQQNKGGWCLNQAASQSQLGWTFTPHRTNSTTEVEPFGPTRGSLFCNSIFNTSVTSRLDVSDEDAGLVGRVWQTLQMSSSSLQTGPGTGGSTPPASSFHWAFIINLLTHG